MKQRDVSQLQLIKIYFKVWFRLTKLRFIEQIINTRFGGLFFILGKTTRLIFQIIFIYLLLKQLPTFQGYSFYESLFILFMLNLNSTLIQMFLRGVYVFRNQVLTGLFDFFLVTPLNELFYSLFAYFDPFDAVMLLPSCLALIFIWSKTNLAFNLTNFGIIVTYLFIAFIFALAWHLIIISLGIRFLEVDNLIIIYRDFEKMGRFPIKIYNHFFQLLLTYFMPVAVMTTIPLQLLLQPQYFLKTTSFFLSLAILFLFLGWRFWSSSLRYYSSASS